MLRHYLFIKPSTKFSNRLMAFVFAFCILGLCFASFVTNQYYYAEVSGLSMFPTINSKASLYNKIDCAYYTTIKKAKKGDIVIVDYEFINSKQDAIKRLIATSGDSICYYNGHILINREILNEPYLDDGYNYLKKNPEIIESSSFKSADEWKNFGYERSKSCFERWCKALMNNEISQEYKNKHSKFFKDYDLKYSNSIVFNETLNTYVLTLPENYVYFLGDNRAESIDCSVAGPAEKKYVLAKVDFIAEQDISPLKKFTKQLKYLFS